METKICSHCKEEKQLLEFGKDKNRKDGLCANCITCARSIAKKWRDNNLEYARKSNRENAQKNRTSRRASAKKYYDNNKVLASNRVLKLRYKVTDEQLAEMRKINKCPICGIEAVHEYSGRGCKKGKIVIDHEHETGNVRGFICSHCNTVLGMVRDNVSYLENAIQYLKNSQKENLYATN